MNAALAVSQLPSRSHASDLRDALDQETHLVAELITVVYRQRAGVVADDIQAVDDSVYAAHRVLRTLEEARRRRRALLGLVAGHEDLPLESLETVLQDEAPDLWRARDGLLAAARTLSRETAVNRRILRQALSIGENRIRTLCGVPAGPGGGGVLVNRTV